jgi:hypothetical protein
MANDLKTKQSWNAVPATLPGVKPGDFPIGSIQSRAAARTVLANHAAEKAQDEAIDLADLTPYERAIAEGEDPELIPTLIALARTVELRAQVFGLPLDEPEKIRHNKRVAKLANELSDGSYGEIITSNPSEAKRFRDLAEEQLKAEAVSGHKDAGSFEQKR